MATPREIKDMLGALVRMLEYVQDIDSVRGGTVYETAKAMVENARKGTAMPMPWTPFRPAVPVRPTRAHILALAKSTGASESDVCSAFESELAGTKLWVNNRYQVAVREMDGDWVHLSIKRIDQETVRDWRDLQRIKNELVGAECEASELYPAESRVADSANQYHLFACRDPSFRFPFGFGERLVSSGSGPHSQRPHEA